jgi:ubiquinone/menaquinone biosynthesis C-methylase UbiE
MPDVYATIASADEAVQERLAEVLELRAADPQQRAMLETYLEDLAPVGGARVLDLGCGTGAVARTLAALPGVGEVVGIDPSSVFIGQARRLSEGIAGLSFEVGDGRALGLPDGSFDAVVLHTVLCHIPEPERALAEAFRVVRDGGRLAIFDGDYATSTVAAYENDPLQGCAEATIAALVHDPWLARRLRRLVSEAGWRVTGMRSHGYLETTDPGYSMTLVDRGADSLVGAGRLGAEAGEALKSEARRRADADEFFGHIAYVSLIAERPGS